MPRPRSIATILSYETPLGRPGNVLKITIRFLQFILGATLSGIYGVQIGRAQHYKGGWDHMYGFTTVVAAITSAIAVLFGFTPIKSYSFWIVDGICFLFWGIVSAVFGVVFLNREVAPIKDGPVIVGPERSQMKAAAGLDLVLMIFWCYTWCSSGWHWWRAKRVLQGGIRMRF